MANLKSKWILGIEIVLIFCYFLNALLILLQQKHAYGGKSRADTSDYVQVAFAITSAALGLALVIVLLLMVGITKNMASLLLPHIFVQVGAFFQKKLKHRKVQEWHKNFT